MNEHSWDFLGDSFAIQTYHPHYDGLPAQYNTKGQLLGSHLFNHDERLFSEHRWCFRVPQSFHAAIRKGFMNLMTR